jgi:monoterpene epsilon-lactone hydrolase
VFGEKAPSAMDEHDRLILERRVKNPLISPVHANLSGMPRILLQVGGDELLYDDCVKFVDRLRSQNISKIG